MKRKKLLPKDKELLKKLKRGGREEAKKDFLTLLKRSVPAKV